MSEGRTFFRRNTLWDHGPIHFFNGTRRSTSSHRLSVRFQASLIFVIGVFFLVEKNRIVSVLLFRLIFLSHFYCSLLLFILIYFCSYLFIFLYFFCSHQDYKLIPFGTGSESPVVVVTNSNVKHSLSDSEYPTRVKQCQDAVKILQVKYPAVKALRDATMVMLDDVKDKMSSTVYNRAKHCITEDVRTLSAVESLATGDFLKLGKLMTASHESLQREYEVSCVELDALVSFALKVEGVYGSRMTGGGFGGCTVTLVERKSVDKLINHLKDEYMKKFGQVCDCYTAAPSPGAGVIDLKTELLKPCFQEKKVLKKSSEMLDYVVPIFVVTLAIGVMINFARK